MSDLSRISSIIENELVELKLVLLEEGEDQIRPYVDEIAKKANGVNKTDLIQIENYKIFLTYFYLTNSIYLSFDETYEMVLENKDSINSWSFNTDGKLLVELFNSLDNEGKVIDNKAYECMTKLNLNPLLINYNLKTACLVMIDFLKLKRDILKANFGNNVVSKRNAIRQIYNKSKIKEMIEVAVKALKEADSKLQERKIIAIDKIKYTNEAKAKVDDLSLLELDEMPEGWHRFLEPELLEEVYNIVFSNLDKREKGINEEIASKEGIVNSNPLISYLYDNGIDINSLNKRLLDELMKKEDIVYIIDYLRKIGLSLSRIFFECGNILVSLNKDKIDRIQFLISSNALSKETLVNNIDLLGSKYNELLVNYEILKHIMDFDSMFYDDRILLESSVKIKNRLSILAHYNLTKNNYIYLLCHFNYLEIYDLLLENRIPLYLFISICETKKPIETIKRIMIYREIGEEFETSSKLLRKEIAMEDRSFIDSTELDDCDSWFSVSSIKGSKISKVLKSRTVKEFDSKYFVGNDVYTIGDALISRPKFLRNFEAVNEDEERIIECLVSGSLLGDKELTDIKREMKGKKTLVI